MATFHQFIGRITNEFKKNAEINNNVPGSSAINLFDTHLLELLFPVFRVIVVIVRRWRELAEDTGVPVMAEVCQVGNVELELTAVLG